MEYGINKDLQKIPLDYFNKTVDSVYLSYINIQTDIQALIERKQKIELSSQEKMIISKKMALEGAIEKRLKNAQEKMVVLNGFMSITSKMCEDRLKELYYALKPNKKQTLSKEEFEDLALEESGIIDYLAKIEQIKNSFPEEEKDNGEEPESV